MVASYDATNDRWRCKSRLYKPGTAKPIIRGHITGPGGDEPLVTDRGFPVIMYQSFGLWGNSTARSRIDAVKTAIQTAGDFAEAAAGDALLTGTSAGALDMLNWAKYNPTLVQAIALSIAVVDPQDVWDNDRGGFKSDVNTAYGGRPADADCPQKNYSAYAGIPMQLYYSDTDPVTPLSILQAFVTGVNANGGNCQAISMGSIGHLIGPPRTPQAVAEWLWARR